MLSFAAKPSTPTDELGRTSRLPTPNNSQPGTPTPGTSTPPTSRQDPLTALAASASSPTAPSASQSYDPYSHQPGTPHPSLTTSYRYIHYGLFRQSLNGTGTTEEWVTAYYAEPSHCNLCGAGMCTYTLALYQSRSHVSSV